MSPDGRLVATGGEDHSVVLRDPLTLEPLLGLPAWTSALRGMAFDGTSRRLALVGHDSDLELWNLASLHDRLTELGLAWDQLAPATAPTNSPPEGRASTTPRVAVLRP
jgi:WD40 repeat protein